MAAVLSSAVLLTAQGDPVSAGFKDGYADVNGIRLHYVTAGKTDRPMIMFVQREVNAQIREFLERRPMPKELVVRTP